MYVSFLVKYKSVPCNLDQCPDVVSVQCICPGQPEKIEIPTIYFKYTKVSSQLKTITGVHKCDNYYQEKEKLCKVE